MRSEETTNGRLETLLWTIRQCGGPAATLVLSFWLGVISIAAAPCFRTSGQEDLWVAGRVNDLVRAARATYQNEDAREGYERIVNSLARTIRRCKLAQTTGEHDFASRYPDLLEYVRLLSLALQEDRELGFEVSDQVYFAETGQYTTIPDFLLSLSFLRAVSRFETLPKAKALLQEMNEGRAAGDQLLFFSYESRHLGTPDNPDSFRRLLVVVPGNEGRRVPEKWVQFGIPEPRAPASVRNVSVVAVLPAAGPTTNIYFKDYYRTYRRNGAIKIKGRWELGEGDDNCVECHKSGVLPIFPVKGSVSPAEQPLVELVNERFRSYGPARFDRYLDINKFGPGLGSPRMGDPVAAKFKSTTCTSCHHANGLGPLNWPMDSNLISSFVKSGRMPKGAQLGRAEHARLYGQLIQDYFAIDNARPGILQAWLLGKPR